jgi:hypothetical protein
MKDILDLVKDLEGIIGALLGVIVTLVLTQMLKSIGKMRFYIKETEIKYLKSSTSSYGSHEEEEVNVIKGATNIKLQHSIEIFNGSESPRILRDAMYSFYKGKKLLFSVSPDDKTTERYGSHRYWIDEFSNINIPPKQIVNINLSKYCDC